MSSDTSKIELNMEENEETLSSEKIVKPKRGKPTLQIYRPPG